MCAVCLPHPSPAKDRGEPATRSTHLPPCAPWSPGGRPWHQAGRPCVGVIPGPAWVPQSCSRWASGHGWASACLSGNLGSRMTWWSCSGPGSALPTCGGRPLAATGASPAPAARPVSGARTAAERRWTRLPAQGALSWESKKLWFIAFSIFRGVNVPPAAHGTVPVTAPHGAGKVHVQSQVSPAHSLPGARVTALCSASPDSSQALGLPGEEPPSSQGPQRPLCSPRTGSRSPPPTHCSLCLRSRLPNRRAHGGARPLGPVPRAPHRPLRGSLDQGGIWGVLQSRTPALTEGGSPRPRRSPPRPPLPRMGLG